jgi:hypothetical protein
MTYQIVLEIPHFNDRDCIDGWSYLRLPNAYETEALARKLAGRRQDGLDEVGAHVVPFGGCPRRDRIQPRFTTLTNSDDFPF